MTQSFLIHNFRYQTYPTLSLRCPLFLRMETENLPFPVLNHSY